MFLSIWFLAGFFVDIFRLYHIYQLREGIPVVLLQYALYELVVLVIICVILIAIILRQTDWNLSHNIILIIAIILISIICLSALLVSAQKIREQFEHPLNKLEQSRLHRNRRKELDRKLPHQTGRLQPYSLRIT